ncbi:MAG: hypothetical protein ACT4PK_09435 [Gammaproteobacteria bacterium]
MPAPPDSPAEVVLPSKGITMAAVKKLFGEPRNQMGPVGGDTPRHPPITRWDYEGFVVIFEKDRVIDAVVPGAPPRIHTTAGLSRASNAPAAPSLPPADMPPPPDQPPPPDTPAVGEASMAPEAPAVEAAPPAEAEPIIPEAPADAPAPAVEPTAEAAPMTPDMQAPAGAAPAAPAAAEVEPPPATPPPVQQVQPAPKVTQTPVDEYGEGPPTPKG